MLAYVLKQLLLLLPTVWLLCSLVFFLSKILPGTFANRQKANTEEALITIGGSNTSISKTPPEVTQPLFYISLRSAAEPDTLYRVQPAAHQVFLKALVLAYGNWPAIAHFYQQLLVLQHHIQQAPAQIAGKQQLLHQVKGIFNGAGTTRLEVSLTSLASQISQQLPAGSNYPFNLAAVQQSLASMQEKAQPWRNWVPVLNWHGTDNQYHGWLKQIARGNLGVSYRDQRLVSAIIAEAFLNTCAITVLSLGFVLSLSLILSNWLSKSAFRKWRGPVLTLLYTLESIPLFVVALLLLTVFASSAYLNIFPAYGLGLEVEADTPFYLVWLYRLPYLVLPVLSLTVVNLPYVTGQIYQAVQQVQQRDYILTAKAKGLSEARVWRGHILRNALLPVITLFTGFLPALVSGAVVIETIYAVPGMGRLLVEAVSARDFPVVIGVVLCLGLIKVLAHLLADVLYYLADPRIRLPA